MIIPCAVCEFPVKVETSKRQVHVDPQRLSQGEETVQTMAVCGSKRCQRLLRETLDEMGRRQVDL